MKPTLLLAMLSMLSAMPRASAAPQLENSRSKAAASGTYVVGPGDALEKIARKNGCSPAALAKINGLKLSSVIHPGQTLKLPRKTAAKSEAAVAAPVAPTDVAGKTHTICEGDTYFSLSKKYGVSVESLIAANPNVKATALRLGQTIRLSAGEPAAKPSSKPLPQAPEAPSDAAAPPAPAPASKSAADPEKPAAETPPPTSPKESNAGSKSQKKVYSVMIEQEMTYAEFAAKYGTDIDRLNDLNGLDLTKATVLAKGSELYVPAQP